MEFGIPVTRPCGIAFFDEAKLAKYDRWNNTNAWQTTKNDTKEYAPSAASWAGHCGGASFASIVLEQPVPKADPQGRGPKYEFTEDELEGLYAFLFRGGNGWDVEWAWTSSVYPISYSEVDHDGKYTVGEPSLQPKPGWEDFAYELGSPDYFAARCHAMIEQHIGLSHPAQVAAQGALLVDFRATTSGGKPNEQWHHAVYAFDAVYIQSSPNPQWVLVTDTLYANADIPPVSNGGSDRKVVYEYWILYENGDPVTPPAVMDAEKNYTIREIRPGLLPRADWISVSGDAFYAPRRIGYVKGIGSVSDRDGVSFDNVKGLDQNFDH